MTPENKKALEQFCRDMAMWEGRHAAIRWLIEFVGVTADKDGKPKRIGKRSFDVDITDLPGGTHFDLNHPDAVVLAKIWKGCSQATSHPTFGSNHPPLELPNLNKAVDIVIQYLIKTVYAHAGVSLKI